MKTTKNFIGIDADLETSLFEYGFICEPYTKDGRTDEYFCLYFQNGRYGSGYITEEHLNDLINGKEWMDWKDADQFLGTVGGSKEEWLEMPFINKLSDLLEYYGSQNIIGIDYSPITEKELRKLYKF